jgi:O-antigen ligase
MAVGLVLAHVARSTLTGADSPLRASGVAVEAATAVLLCVFAAALYAEVSVGWLALWLVAATLPILSAARAGIAAALLSMPLSCASLRPKRRFIWVLLIMVGGTLAFYAPQIQQKMFRRGYGSVDDVVYGTTSVETHGRLQMWQRIWDAAWDAPALGHGANASEALVVAVTGGLTHPHNDWLRLLYDYGLAGLLLYGWASTCQIVSLLRLSTRLSGNAAALARAAAGSYVVLALYMLTDNVLLYSAHYGALQFAIVGFVYGTGAGIDRRPLIPAGASRGPGGVGREDCPDLSADSRPQWSRALERATHDPGRTSAGALASAAFELGAAHEDIPKNSTTGPDPTTP